VEEIIMVELIKPSIEYKDSFLEAVREYQEEKARVLVDSAVYKLNADELEKDFDSFILKLENAEKGIDLPEGYVPHTELWLVDNGKYIGTIDIRHVLNKHLEEEGGNIGYSIRPSERLKGYGTEILRLGIIAARSMGVERLRVTCDDLNTGSAKIIEKNGGILEGKIVNSKGILKRRYWINN
jgi:predicted acetyltransferase